MVSCTLFSVPYMDIILSTNDSFLPLVYVLYPSFSLTLMNSEQFFVVGTMAIVISILAVILKEGFQPSSINYEIYYPLSLTHTYTRVHAFIYEIKKCAFLVTIC